MSNNTTPKSADFEAHRVSFTEDEINEIIGFATEYGGIVLDDWMILAGS